MFSTIIIILAYIFLVVGSLCVALGFWQDWEEVNNAKKPPRNCQKGGKRWRLKSILMLIE